MDGDGPSQAQGQLLERPLDLRLYFPRLFVQGVARVLPLQRLYIDGFRVALTIDAQLPVACLLNSSDASVVVAMLAGRVVLHKHHLRPFLQDERLSRGVGVIGERTLDFRFVCIGKTRQFLQLRLVIVVGDVVVGGEADVRLFRAGDECRIVSGVELRERFCRGMSAAHLAK